MIYVAIQKTADPPIQGPFIVKVGYTHGKLRARMAQLHSDCLFVLPGDKQRESEIHRRFKHARRYDIGRDWLALTYDELNELFHDALDAAGVLAQDACACGAPLYLVGATRVCTYCDDDSAADVLAGLGTICPTVG